MSDTVLDIRNLTVGLPTDADRPLAIDDVSLVLGRREILCIVGESGSGKSMLSRAIMGLLPPRVRAVHGEILFKDRNLLAATSEQVRLVRGREISMIFQEPMTALNPLMTIGAQIDEAIRIHTPMDAHSRANRVVEILASVHLPEPQIIRRSYPHQLSGGQRQRAMIAMALSLGPSILIADEPTTALDVTTQAQILGLIKEVQAARDMSVIFITHDFGVVADMADRVAVMQLGKVVETGSAHEVLGRARHPYTQSLVAAVPRMAPRPMKTGTQAPVILAANRVHKTYVTQSSIFRRNGRVVHAVKDASFSVRKGETLGLVGESGSGKSTLARCMCRLVRADSGEAMLDRIDIQALSRKQMRPMHKRVQMVFQDPYGSLNPRLTVADLIAEGPIVHGTSRQEALKKAYSLLELVGLDARAGGRFPHEFSGGQRQRIALARALAVEPEVLIADEPVSALDVSVQAQILKLLADTRDRLGLTMLFVTHDLRVASQVCDTVAVMRNGEIVESGATESVFTSPQHPYTVALMAAVPGQAWHREALAPGGGLRHDPR